MENEYLKKNAAENSFQGDLCMLFADVSGSVTLFEQKGDKNAKELLANSLNLLTEISTKYSG